MAVYIKPKGSDKIPEGAVVLTEERAIQYQMSILDKWPNYSEVWALRIGPGILSGTSILSSFIINNHFRYKLKLGQYGRFSSYMSVIAIPAMISSLFHVSFVQTYLVLHKYECPMCLQVRAGLLQASTGVVYPFILAPLAAFMFATRHFTYRLPSLTTQTKDVLRLWWKFTKSANTLGGGLLAVNMFVAMYITSKAMQQHANVNLQLEEYEKKVESGSISMDDEMRA